MFHDRNSSDWMLSHGMFRRSGLVPDVVLEVEAIEIAKKMVERGLGLAFLPHLAVTAHYLRAQAKDLEDSPMSRTSQTTTPQQKRGRDVPLRNVVLPYVLAWRSFWF